jgi:hypothetical protein
MNVPYTVTLTKNGGWKKKISGVWQGVSTFNVQGEYIKG